MKSIALILLPGLMLLFACRTASLQAESNTVRGREKIAFYGCGSCHTIRGVRGANGLVGPPLDNIASRAYIAGVLPNNAANMTRWLADPQAIVPHNVMPNVNATPDDVQDMVAYLGTLH